MDIWDFITHAWHWIIAAVSVMISTFASGHALLYKRDPRAAALWIIVIWVLPLVGSCCYFLMGVNRIRRHAVSLRGGREKHTSVPSVPPCPPESLDHHLPADGRHLPVLAALVDKVVSRRLVPGNQITPLRNGDEAYPVMLQAIQDARSTISLATYIFDKDSAGKLFAEALGQAVQRGVAVRVLIDDAGVRYSWPTILKTLCQAGVSVARFLPSLAPWKLTAMNLRNHRKILVTDGRLGFTGGMNIRAGHWLKPGGAKAIQDLQFRIEGPVVAHLQEVFVDDWAFCTGETLRGPEWFPAQSCPGRVVARGIADGPDEDFEKLRWTLLGALSSARRSIQIMTPYFLPDPALISGLNLAAMRGVRVDIILPGKNNLPMVHWAAFAILWQVLERGCRVWITPPPFDHSKLMLVDECWSLIGSANWDPRSLRLNFEFNVECYDPELATVLKQLVAEKLARAREVTLAEVDSRALPIRLRDGLARLAIPFL
jgi:cardiolipin synthase